MPPRERRCNSVRKVVHPGATEFTYEREVQPLPRLGPWKEALEPAWCMDQRRGCNYPNRVMGQAMRT